MWHPNYLAILTEFDFQDLNKYLKCELFMLGNFINPVFQSTVGETYNVL